MAWPIPNFSKSDINRAGQIIASSQPSYDEYLWAQSVLTNWRACHGYPINTFQATLRTRVGQIDDNGIVAQRLKRTSSIVSKLRRFPDMQLARMQDIGGLRAIVNSIDLVKDLQSSYVTRSRLRHELINTKDYIVSPKPDGYRGVHLIYKYVNPFAPEYEGLRIEMQLRTRLQHAWATAVETMGIFLGQALKSRQGEARWLKFFEIASAAFAITERSPPVPGWEGYTRNDVFEELQEAERELGVLEKLRGFSVAIDVIVGQKRAGSYHLVVLDAVQKTVSVTPFSVSDLGHAVEEYARIESDIVKGAQLEAVLVQAGPVEQMKRAYPNYFLDTTEFVKKVKASVPRRISNPRQRRLFS